MSEEKDIRITKVAEPAGLTNEQLFRLLNESLSEQAKSNKLLAEALLESRKPYVDPAVLEQKRIALEEKKAAVALEMRKRVLTKQQCLHLRTNSDGTFDDRGKMNIKWQEHSNGIILGVCGTCFSQFDTRNPKDRELLLRDGKSVKNMGRARENTRLM